MDWALLFFALIWDWFQAGFMFALFARAISLTVHSAFSSSFTSLLVDVAVVAYVLFRVYRRGGLIAVRSHFKDNMKDAAMVVSVSFVLVFVYYIVRIPRDIYAASYLQPTPAFCYFLLPNLPAEALMRTDSREAQVYFPTAAEIAKELSKRSSTTVQVRPGMGNVKERIDSLVSQLEGFQKRNSEQDKAMREINLAREDFLRMNHTNAMMTASQFKLLYQDQVISIADECRTLYGVADQSAGRHNYIIESLRQTA